MKHLLIAFSAICFCLVLQYQGCSMALEAVGEKGLDSESLERDSLNGDQGPLYGGDSEPFTGREYVRDLETQSCADGSTISDLVIYVVEKDIFVHARENCEDLNPPVILDKAMVELLGPDAEMLIYDGDIYRDDIPEPGSPDSVVCLAIADLYYKNILAADIIVGDLVDAGKSAEVIADAEAYRDDWQRKFNSLPCRDSYLTGRNAKVFNLSLNQSQNNFTLRNELITLGWDGISDVSVEITVENGVVIGSVSTSRPAMNFVGLPQNSSISLINNGYIVGKGGSGGGSVGRIYTYFTENNSKLDGEDGGTAVYASTMILLNNNGVIGGGGGGGGAGYPKESPNLNNTCNLTGYGGGGGAGNGLGGEGYIIPGSDGGAQNRVIYSVSFVSGDQGSSTMPGDGGVPGSGCLDDYIIHTIGADGGLLGENGKNSFKGKGGNAGESIKGAEFIDWTSNTGSVLGVQSLWINQ